MRVLVSIIIPAFNAQETIARAVGSAAKQSIKDLEIIVVDDGSTDQTRDIVEELAKADRRIHMLVKNTKDGKGVSAARNRGLDAAEGEYFTFLDADDVLSEHFVERMLQIKKQTNAVICGCGFCSVKTGDTTPVFGEEMSDGTGEIEIFRGGQIVKDAILKRDTRVWSKLFDREIVGDLRFREGLSIGEDMLFVLSVLDEKTDYARTNEKLYGYTINPNGAMERPFTPSFMDQLTCWSLAEEMIRKNLPGLSKDAQTAAALAGIQVVSGTLTASKIVTRMKGMPADISEKELEKDLQICTEYVKRARNVPGAVRTLDADYKIKSRLLISMPSLYRWLYQRK